MKNKHITVSWGVAYKKYHVGQKVKVAVDKNNVPLEHEWRNILKDARLEESRGVTPCVSILDDAPAQTKVKK